MIVLKPIKVPDSENCWDGKTCCGHFNNEGGHPWCEERLGSLEYDRETGYVKKCTECLALKKEKS